MAKTSLVRSKIFLVCLLLTGASAQASFWADWVYPCYNQTVHAVDEYAHKIAQKTLAYDFVQKLLSTPWKQSVPNWANLAIEKSRLFFDRALFWRGMRPEAIHQETDLEMGQSAPPILSVSDHHETDLEAGQSTQPIAQVSVVQPTLPAREDVRLLRASEAVPSNVAVPVVPPTLSVNEARTVSSLSLPVALPLRELAPVPVIAQEVMLEGVQNPAAPGNYVRLRTRETEPLGWSHPANMAVAQHGDLSIAQRIKRAWDQGHSYRIVAITDVASTTTGLHQGRVQIFDFAELWHAFNKQSHAHAMKVMYNPSSYIWIRDLRLLNVLRYDVHRGMFVRDDAAKNKLLERQSLEYVNFYLAATQGAARHATWRQQPINQRGALVLPEIAGVPAIKTFTGDQACVGFDFDLQLANEHAEYWHTPCFSLANLIQDAYDEGRPFYLAVLWEVTAATADCAASIHPFCFDSEFLKSALEEQPTIDQGTFIFSIPGGRNPITRRNIDPNKLFVYCYNELTHTFEPNLDEWLRVVQKLPLNLFKS